MEKKYGEQPEWASKTPTSSSYYYGIGIVNKNITDYRNAATKIALDNLINEISVNVSSTSLFSTLETEESFNQEFSQNIHLSSKETIEGYELVDSWENENQYFVFYQLSKVKYKQFKEKRIDIALDRSKKTYLAAQVLKESGNYKQALVNQVQALEILNPFLDQDLTITVNGANVNLAVQIVQSIKSFENGIMITPSFTKKNIKVGESIGAEDLYVVVTDNSGKRLSNIPLVFTHKAVSSKRKSTNSNNDGVAKFALGKIKSHKALQTISVNFDFNSIIEDATKNRIIRKIINYQSSRNVQIELNVTSPSVFIKGSELFDGVESKLQFDMESKIQNSLLENKFEIANSEKNADLILKYDLHSNIIKKGDPLQVVSTLGTIVITEKSKIIYSHNLALQKGAHMNLNEALISSYNKTSQQIQKRVIPQFSSKYFNY